MTLNLVPDLNKAQFCFLRDRFTVQRMLIYQNAVFLSGHAVSMIIMTKQYDQVIMLSKNQSAHSPGSHLHLTNLNICK